MKQKVIFIGINLATLYLAEKKMSGPYAKGDKLTEEHVISHIASLNLSPLKTLLQP